MACISMMSAQEQVKACQTHGHQVVHFAMLLSAWSGIVHYLCPLPNKGLVVHSLWWALYPLCCTAIGQRKTRSLCTACICIMSAQ